MPLFTRIDVYVIGCDELFYSLVDGYVMPYCKLEVNDLLCYLKFQLLILP
jgi:hypothetical protein